MAKTPARTQTKKEAPATSGDAAVIRRQLAWTFGILFVLAAAYGVWWLGDDRGWGNADRAVTAKLASAFSAL